MAGLPSGTVTLLFTDIAGSTRLLHELGDGYAEVLADHRRALRTAVSEHGGIEVDTQGDAFLIAFARPSDAVAAAHAAQRALARSKVRVRMGLHTGDPTLTAEGYVGIDVHRGARICAAGHGGQVLLSKRTRQLIDPGIEVSDLGEHRLKDLREPEWLFQLLAPDLERRFPPLRSLSNTNLPAEAGRRTTRTLRLKPAWAVVLALAVAGCTSPAVGGPPTAAVAQSSSSSTITATPSQAITPAPPAKTAQSITFGELPALIHGAQPFTVSATATSGLAVAFQASGACSISGRVVSIGSAGQCTVVATQDGDATWQAASRVTRTGQVAKADQQITLSVPLIRYGRGTVAISATSTSPLAVSATVSGACTVARGLITAKGLIGNDTCMVTATQAGDANFNSAPPATVQATVIGLSWSCCNVIYAPPSDFCLYFSCIGNFGNSAGYVMQCADGLFSTAGGIRGSCSGHGGNARALYIP